MKMKNDISKFRILAAEKCRQIGRLMREVTALSEELGDAHNMSDPAGFFNDYLPIGESYPFQKDWNEMAYDIIAFADAIEEAEKKDDKRNELWYGQDIVIAYGDVILLIAEGTGDNLLPEDIAEGFVDYFSLDVFEKSEVTDLDRIYEASSIGGGFMMRSHAICEEFYGESIDNVVRAVFIENGKGDAFDLYSSVMPEYALLKVGEEVVQ